TENLRLQPTLPLKFWPLDTTRIRAGIENPRTRITRKRRIIVRMIRYATSIFIIICFASLANSQKLSLEEQRIANYVDAHATEAVALLEKVVNIESATQNLAGVKQVGQVFKSEFESIGLTARWIDMPSQMNRAGHLLAENPGASGRGKRILLL